MKGGTTVYGWTTRERREAIFKGRVRPKERERERAVISDSSSSSNGTVCVSICIGRALLH